MKRFSSSNIVSIVKALILLMTFCGYAAAQEGAAPVPSEPSPQVRQFLDLLAAPAVQEWLLQARKLQDSQEHASQEHASQERLQQEQAQDEQGQDEQGQETAMPPAPAASRASTSASLANLIANTRRHIQEIVAAFPHLPARIAEAGGRLSQTVRSDRGAVGAGLAVAAFALGAAGAFTTRRLGIGATHAWQQAHPEPAGRLKRLGIRLLIAALPALAFAAGVLVVLLLFEWPLMLKHMVIAYALAVVAILLVHHALRVLLANPEPFRQPDGGAEAEAEVGDETETGAGAEPETRAALKADPARTAFWHRRLVLFVGYFALALATVETLRTLGMPESSVKASAYLLGLGLLGISIEAVWRRPQAGETAPKQLGTQAVNILLTILGIALWWLWATGLKGLFWLLAFAFLLPVAIRAIDLRIMHVLRPEGTARVGGAGVLEVCLTRGARLILVVGAVYWLSAVWSIDLIALTGDTTPLKRLTRGILNAVITLFLADFLWQIIRAMIDARLAQTGPAAAHGDEAPASGGAGIGHGEDPVRQARLRTLLPIFRHILFVVIAVIAILMSLSGLGVEIGPLIAGAGVVGVAVGFGSQTLVKDVISGIFYLLDDAFRIGEYIQSGNYKGRVESFSLRSVKLRHHRGPIYTVPFGQLGAVQNMSRDWVMDKFTFNVAFDTDLEKARKIIKTIGQQLADDPDHAANILEPLKMQGVEQFGQYGMQIKCKMMTRPGEQFLLRRMALRQIKQAFDDAGISFALPQVKVAGNEDKAATAAEQVRLSLAVEPAKEA